MENTITPLPLSGYLQKRGEKGPFRSYKKRWFEQNGSKIFYFAEKSNKTPLGFIDCGEITGLRRTNETAANTESPKSTARRDSSVPFEVVTSNRVYELIAPTKKDCRYWMDGITQYLEYQGNQIRAKSLLNVHEQRVTSLQEKLENVSKRNTLQSIKWEERNRELEREISVLHERLKKQETDMRAQQQEADQRAAEQLERIRLLSQLKKDLESERLMRKNQEGEMALVKKRMAEQEKEVNDLSELVAKKDAQLLTLVMSQESEEKQQEEDHAHSLSMPSLLDAEIQRRKQEVERLVVQHKQQMEELAESKQQEWEKSLESLKRVQNDEIEQVKEEMRLKADEERRLLEIKVGELSNRLANKKAKIKRLQRQLSDSVTAAAESPHTPQLNIKSPVRDLERELQEKDKQLRNWEAKLAESQQNLDKLTQHHSVIKLGVEGKLSEMEKELHAKNQQLAAMRDKLQGQDDGNVEELALLKEQLSQKDAALNALLQKQSEAEVMIEHLKSRLQEIVEQKGALAGRFEELIVSSEYASKEYTDQRRKYEEKVTKLKQILQEKEEEILAIKNKSQECNCINQVTTDALRAQLESLHRQLFFSLAVGIKLSLSMQGLECHTSTATMYEEALKDEVPTHDWNGWIFQRLHAV